MIAVPRQSRPVLRSLALLTAILAIGGISIYWWKDNPYRGRYVLVALQFNEDEGFVDPTWHTELSIGFFAATSFVTLPNGCKSISKFKNLSREGATLNFSESENTWLASTGCSGDGTTEKNEAKEIFVRKDGQHLYWQDRSVIYKYQKVD